MRRVDSFRNELCKEIKEMEEKMNTLNEQYKLNCSNGIETDSTKRKKQTKITSKLFEEIIRLNRKMSTKKMQLEILDKHNKHI